MLNYQGYAIYTNRGIVSLYRIILDLNNCLVLSTLKKIGNSKNCYTLAVPSPLEFLVKERA